MLRNEETEAQTEASPRNSPKVSTLTRGRKCRCRDHIRDDIAKYITLHFHSHPPDRKKKDEKEECLILAYLFLGSLSFFITPSYFLFHAPVSHPLAKL